MNRGESSESSEPNREPSPTEELSPTEVLPMFPLGTVLLPGAMLQLQVFEPRYSALMNTVMATRQEFGVTLIERGAEVGGGDQRLPVGCVAKVLLAQPLGAGRWILQAIGTDRFSVNQWLPEDPYPLAEVHRFGETSTEDAELFEAAAASPISTLDAYSILAAENSRQRWKLLHSALAHVEELRQAQRQWGDGQEWGGKLTPRPLRCLVLSISINISATKVRRLTRSGIPASVLVRRETWRSR